MLIFNRKFAPSGGKSLAASPLIMISCRLQRKHRGGRPASSRMICMSAAAIFPYVARTAGDQIEQLVVLDFLKRYLHRFVYYGVHPLAKGQLIDAFLSPHQIRNRHARGH